MTYFSYRKTTSPSGSEPQEQLWCENVALTTIAKEIGTPLYIYAQTALEDRYKLFSEAIKARFPKRNCLIAYAVKANPNLSIIKLFGKIGAGADTVSQGEIIRSLKAGIAPEKIVFSGVGKTDVELYFALQNKIGMINIESPPELDRLIMIAKDLNVKPFIAIRVNPDIDAKSHSKISTGTIKTKFGVSLSEARELYLRASLCEYVTPVGLACHIGSQITDITPLKSAFRAIGDLAMALRAQGCRVDRLDLGGGLGVSYTDDFSSDPLPLETYAQTIAETLGPLDCDFIFEPGRFLTANAGIVLSRVIQTHKRPEGQAYVILDAGMNDFLRPALYGAHHEIRSVCIKPDQEKPEIFDIVGPVCETSDIFAKGVSLVAPEHDDLMVIYGAGAYGASMSNQYNSRPLIAEVLVKDSHFTVIRRRPDYDDMLSLEN